MKKSALFFALLFVCGILLCSCGEAAEIKPAGEVRLNYDRENEVMPSDGSNSKGAIVVKDKKLSYHDTDLIIMHVANTTERDYGVTISATYYDGEGNEIKCEEQSFAEFASGFEKYFMFRPGVEFAAFEYTVETSRANGKCQCAGFSSEFIGLVKGRFPNMQSGYGAGVMPTYIGVSAERNDSEIVLDIGIRYLILFNGNGEIDSISTNGTSLNWQPHSADDGMENKSFPVHQGTKEEIDVWFDELGDDYFGIIVIGDVSRSKIN